MTLSTQQQDAIAAYLDAHVLQSGLGTKESACSIAAINLALTGELTADIPDCMSLVIGKWIIPIQDAMPFEMRNSPAWKSLLPLAAGTGRDPDKENARLELILAYMWDALALLQPLADEKGFGSAWTKMLKEKSAAAADAAADAGAYAAAYAAANAAADAFAAYAAAHDAATRAGHAADATINLWPQINPPALLERLVVL